MIIAIDILAKIKQKRRKEADNALRKAKRAIQLIENKTKKILKDREIKVHKEEKVRVTIIKQ